MPTSVLIETGSLDAKPGSREWAIAIRLRLQSVLHDAQSSVGHARGYLRLFEEHAGYRVLEDRGGRKFASMADFAKTREPYGLGYDPVVIDRIKAERDTKKRIGEVVAEAKANPMREPGRPRAGEEKGANGTITKGSNQSRYLTRRLARDAPDVLDALERGEFRSVRAAAIAAGIVKVPTPLEVAMKAVAKLGDKDRAAFDRWYRQNSKGDDQ